VERRWEQRGQSLQRLLRKYLHFCNSKASEVSSSKLRTSLPNVVGDIRVVELRL
jgi:hypothetical protein